MQSYSVPERSAPSAPWKYLRKDPAIWTTSYSPRTKLAWETNPDVVPATREQSIVVR